MPRRFDRDDVSDRDALFRILDEQQQRIELLEAQIVKLGKATRAASTLTADDMEQVREALQIDGVAPLNLSNLPGVTANPQRAGVDVLTALPNANLYEAVPLSQLIIVTGPPDVLYYVKQGNPQTLVQLLLSGAIPANMVTTDTSQTIVSTGTKTVQASWTFTANQAITAASNASIGLTVTDTHAGTDARAILATTNDTGRICEILAHGSGRVATRYGFTLANCAELLGFGAISALLIGTIDNAPIIFGQNAVERGRVNLNGWTFGGGTDLAGAYSGIWHSAEEITLSTSGTTTDSSNNLIAANCILLGCTIIIRTTISGGGVTSVQVGESTTANRFTTLGTLTAPTTAVGVNQLQGGITTDATGPVNFTARKLRLTANATPTQGKVFAIVHFIPLSPPTS